MTQPEALSFPRDLYEAELALKQNFMSRALLIETNLHWQSSDEQFLFTADCEGVPEVDNPQDISMAQLSQLRRWQIQRLGRPDINNTAELTVYDLVNDEVGDLQLRVCRLEIAIEMLGDDETRLALNAAMVTQRELGMDIPDMLDSAGFDNAIVDLRADTNANFKIYDESIDLRFLES